MGLSSVAAHDVPGNRHPLIMSLKAFHLVFVTALSSLAFGCAVWKFRAYADEPCRRRLCLGHAAACWRRGRDGLRALFPEETQERELPVKAPMPKNCATGV